MSETTDSISKKVLQVSTLGVIIFLCALAFILFACALLGLMLIFGFPFIAFL